MTYFFPQRLHLDILVRFISHTSPGNNRKLIISVNWFTESLAYSHGPGSEQSVTHSGCIFGIDAERVEISSLQTFQNGRRAGGRHQVDVAVK